LVETLVWNEKTGNLVSGHQRLSITDEKMKYPEKVSDYSLSVSVVDLDDKTERELNVWLNNQSAMGHFDEAGLSELLKLDGMNLEGIGFTTADLELEFGRVDAFLGQFQKEKLGGDELREQIEALKDRKKKVRKSNVNSEEEDADYMLMVVFDSAKAKEQWLEQSGFPVNARFISSAEMLAVTQ
jgi:hypothetical protein